MRATQTQAQTSSANANASLGKRDGQPKIEGWRQLAAFAWDDQRFGPTLAALGRRRMCEPPRAASAALKILCRAHRGDDGQNALVRAVAKHQIRVAGDARRHDRRRLRVRPKRHDFARQPRSGGDARAFPSRKFWGVPARRTVDATARLYRHAPVACRSKLGRFICRRK